MSFESTSTTVKDLTTPAPFIVKKDKTIKDVLELMMEKSIQRLPVVNANNQLIGLIVHNQILKKLYDYMKK